MPPASRSPYILRFFVSLYILPWCFSPKALATPSRANIFGGARTSFAYRHSAGTPEADIEFARAGAHSALAACKDMFARATCATLSSLPMTPPPPYRLSAHPRCVEPAVCRSAALQLQQSSVTDSQACAFRAQTEPNPVFGNALCIGCCCAALPPSSPYMQGIQDYPPLGAFAFSGRPCVVLFNTASSAISVVQWW